MSSVAQALSRALHGPDTLALELDLEQPHRFIVFSDQHKGAADGADEFRRCKPAYEAALRHYIERDFTVVLLGDVEELWEQGFSEVERAHGDILMLERSFSAPRYHRIWGNHDDRWMSARRVREDLAPYLPAGATVHEALHLDVQRAGISLGRLVLLHGHQGTMFSDRMSWVSRIFLRPYRWIQRLTGWGQQTPAKDSCLRRDHDKEMYTWALAQEKLILIAGHTHRPVWSGLTHLRSLEWELALLMNRPDMEAFRDEIAALEARIESKKDEDRRSGKEPCDDEFRTRPVYFNAGCCKFSDGDITGLELEDGELRLIKWTSEPMPDGPIVLESGRLEVFLARRSPTSREGA
jgi:UDP-2,3-diacylglucosamine pyrophosphatase LpxH